jgi:hypothetical protein
MQYILMDSEIVREVIPEINQELPGIPIEQRYPAKFLRQCVQISDDVEVAQGWVYDPEAGTFAPPPEPDIPIEDIPAGAETVPTYLEQLRADVDYLLMMGGA